MVEDGEECGGGTGGEWGRGGGREVGFDGGIVGTLEDVEDVESIGEVFEVRVERVLELGEGRFGDWVGSGGTGFEVVLEGELGSWGAGGVEFCSAKVHEAAGEEGGGGRVVWLGGD